MASSASPEVTIQYWSVIISTYFAYKKQIAVARLAHSMQPFVSLACVTVLYLPFFLTDMFILFQWRLRVRIQGQSRQKIFGTKIQRTQCIHQRYRVYKQSPIYSNMPLFLATEYELVLLMRWNAVCSLDHARSSKACI